MRDFSYQDGSSQVDASKAKERASKVKTLDSERDLVNPDEESNSGIGNATKVTATTEKSKNNGNVSTDNISPGRSIGREKQRITELEQKTEENQ